MSSENWMVKEMDGSATTVSLILVAGGGSPTPLSRLPLAGDRSGFLVMRLRLCYNDSAFKDNTQYSCGCIVRRLPVLHVSTACITAQINVLDRDNACSRYGFMGNI